jgi:serine/threonine protein kinase
VIHNVKSVLSHIHDRGFLQHNDLKANNIVLELSKDLGKCNPVIIDFGKSSTILSASLKKAETK